MPSHRITLISNTNQSQKITFLLPSPPNLDTLFKTAKQKLRLKKPSRIFIPGGTELISSSDLEKNINNGAEYLISCGEEYIGAIKPTSTEREEGEECRVSIIAKEAVVENEAVEQLYATAALKGMRQVVGMPDLHPGLKSPVGATFITEGIIYPSLIGGDIGCGMAVYRTSLKASQVDDSHVKKLADQLTGIEGAWEKDVKAFLLNYLSAEDIEKVSEWDESLGTIGAGNHFAELQLITESTSQEFSEDEVVLVVHSGSRGLGKQILKESDDSYSVNSAEAQEYLQTHDRACCWATANRDLIALRFLSRIFRQELSYADITSRKILDIWHNNVTCLEANTYIHRKGAAPASAEIIVIPGSRGTLSAYVKPISTYETAFSLAHGAGRSQSRSSALKKLAKRYTPEELKRTKLGGWVICEDKELIYEEAPEGYKDVECVVRDLVDANACEVIAWGIPRVSYKVRKTL